MESELEVLCPEKNDWAQVKSELNIDLNLAVSQASTTKNAWKEIKGQLDTERLAWTTAKSALANAEETSRLRYRYSGAFKNAALVFAQQEHLETLAHEWLATSAVDNYLVSVGKEDYYSRYSMMQEEIYATLKTRDPKFTPATTKAKG